MGAKLDLLLHVSSLQKWWKRFCGVLSSCARRSSLAAVFRSLCTALPSSPARRKPRCCLPPPARALFCCLLPVGVAGRCALKIKGARTRGRLRVWLRGSALSRLRQLKSAARPCRSSQPDLDPSPLVNSPMLLPLMISLLGAQM